MSQIIDMIDGALKSAVYEGSSLITLDTLRQVCTDRGIVRASGGFGYMGGDYSA